MNLLDSSGGLFFLPVLLILMITGAASGQGGPDDSMASDQLILSIYIDDAGKALINGYADDPRSLSFLNSSEYDYEEDSRQIYAITGVLTSKHRDNWTVNFVSEGSYDVYQILLYMPANAKLKRVECSSGLDYLVFTANDSVVAEIRGSDVINPAVNIEYLIDIAGISKAETGMSNGASTGYTYAMIALLLIIGAGLVIISLRSNLMSPKSAGRPGPHERADAGESYSKPLDLRSPIDEVSDFSYQAAPFKDDAKNDVNDDVKEDLKLPPIAEIPEPEKKQTSSIEMTGEISAVMDMLTDKEQSIFKVLLQRGGAMTQTEIRYELDISKSSLSGILTSMEKRKIITKKELGRTNVIGLSERFLNTQERS